MKQSKTTPRAFKLISSAAVSLALVGGLFANAPVAEAASTEVTLFTLSSNELMAASADGTKLLANVSGAVNEYDLTGSITQTFTPYVTGPRTTGPDGAWYILDSAQIYRCAAAVCSVWGTVPADMAGLSFNPAGNQLWVAPSSVTGALRVYNVTTSGGVSTLGALAKTVATPPAPSGYAEWQGIAVGSNGVYLCQYNHTGFYTYQSDKWTKVSFKSGRDTAACQGIWVDSSNRVYVKHTDSAWRLDNNSGWTAYMIAASPWRAAFGGGRFFYANWSNKYIEVTQPETIKTNPIVATAATQVKVTLSANGGSLNGAKSSFEVLSGSAVGSLPTPTRSSYSFLGWYTAASGGTLVTSTTKVTGDLKLYAHWTKTVKTVKFNVNGGKKLATSKASKKVSYGKAYGTLPKPARSGWVFAGWTTTKNGSTIVTAKTILKSTATTITLYAKWTPPVKYIPVSVKGSKVTIGKAANVTVPKGAKITLKPKYTVSGAAAVSSVKLTVKKGSKTVASQKTSVDLGAGSYKVTTQVAYKTYTNVKGVVAKKGTAIDVKCSASWSMAFTGAGGVVISVLVSDLVCTSDLLDSKLVLGDVSCTAATGFACGTTGVKFSGSPPTGGFSATAAKYTTPKDITQTVKKWSATKKTSKTQTLKIK